MESRVCNCCTEEKPLDAFERLVKSWRRTCKKCRSKQRRQCVEHEQRLRTDSQLREKFMNTWYGKNKH